MIEIIFICDTCGEERSELLDQAQGLKLQPLPPEWIAVIEKLYCGKCRKYAGVTLGPEVKNVPDQQV